MGLFGGPEMTEQEKRIHQQRGAGLYYEKEGEPLLMAVEPTDDAPLPDMLERIEVLETFARRSVDANESALGGFLAIENQLSNLATVARDHDSRLASLEALVKRIATHLGIEGGNE